MRPDSRRGRHRIADCRKGLHTYGEAQAVGAGILRRVCPTCASVSIDLTGAYEMEPAEATEFVRKIAAARRGT